MNLRCPFSPSHEPKGSKTDILKSINEKFRDVYSKTKQITLAERVNQCVIVCQPDQITFFQSGKIWKENISIIPQLYEDLKTVSHIPFTIYLLVDPFSQGRTADFPIHDLKDFYRLVRKAEMNLQDLFSKANPAILQNQIELIKPCVSFMEDLMEKRSVRREDLIQFARDATPYIKENFRYAAASQINELHKQVMEYKATLSKEQWEHITVVIMGSHMARRGFVVSQYFARLLRVDEDEDKKLIFAEGTSDVCEALDLLATNATDTEASHAFFGDPEYMHSDILKNYAEEVLENMWNCNVEAKNKPEVS